MSDQSVIRDLDEDEFNFIDNEPDTPDLSMPVDDELMETLVNNISTGEMEKSEVLNSNYDFTPEQRSIIEAL